VIQPTLADILAAMNGPSSFEKHLLLGPIISDAFAHPFETPPWVSPFWYFPAFFTSIWLWLYAASGFFLKAAKRFNIGFEGSIAASTSSTNLFKQSVSCQVLWWPWSIGALLLVRGC